MVELHTGAYCDGRARAPAEAPSACSQALQDAAPQAAAPGPRGPRRPRHRLRDASTPVAAIPEVAELNIGHFLIGEAIFIGLDAAIQRMRALMDEARAAGEAARMIIGIGSDLTDIRRIEKTLERFGERFTHRIFTEVERARSERKADRAASYAKRFAAKEACAKALGTGMRARRLLARHGGGQPALRPADHGADRRRGRAAGAR